jgi:hypothetical protein
MRTAEELIEEIRFNTNNIDNNRYTDAAILRFLNSAIRQIQRVIFTSNPTAEQFTKVKNFVVDTSAQQEVIIKLPSDIYASNAVTAVYPIRTDGRRREPLQKIDERESLYKSGFFIRDNKLYLSSGSIGTSTGSVDIVYTKRLNALTSITDTPDLPDTVEDFLTTFSERKLLYVDSSKAIGDANVLSNEEKSDIGNLFANNNKSIKYPAVTDETYVTY